MEKITEKKSKYPVFLVDHKNGNVTKCKSAQELKIYRDNSHSSYFKVDHYPSNEEVKVLLDSLGEKTDDKKAQ